MNIHVPENIQEKYFNFEFRGKPFEKQGRKMIDALNHSTQMSFFYSFEEDFFWLANCEVPTWKIRKQ